MKKIVAVIVLMLLFAFDASPVLAQESDAMVDSVATEQGTAVEHLSLHRQIKQKFIEGSALFMSLIALVFVAGLAFCIERIIYLNISQNNAKHLLSSIEESLMRGDTEAAKNVCSEAHGPIAAICHKGLQHIDQGSDVVEKSVVAQGNIQVAGLEKRCSWIRLFITIAPALGFLGTIIGMVQAFDKIQVVGDMSASVVAGGMKVALISTIFGLVSALILQVFYSYILSKINSMSNEMEDASISFLDLVIRYNMKYKR